MTRDLGASGSVSIAQLTGDVLPGFGQKRQNRLVALLAFVLRVIPFAPAHLMTEQRIDRGVGVQRNGLQIHMSGLPDPLPQNLLHPQELTRYAEMQRGKKAPE